MNLIPVLLLLFGRFLSITAYGWMGHEIIASLAQKLLTPNVTIIIQTILQHSDGDLASVAAWADRIKRRPEYRFTSPLHYINTGDYPPKKCEFSWVNGSENVVTAIRNYTTRLHNEIGWPREEALRFLIHYVGDIHQPLHLSGRDRGGNSAPAIFEGHSTNLHTIWDTQILNKKLRELENTLFNDDNNLNSLFRIQKRWKYDGNIYDLYIIHLLKLLKTKFKKEMIEWTLCPGNEDNINPCPEYWAELMCSLNCEIVWNGYDAHTELSNGTYYDRIENTFIIEKLLLMGGVRLAAILNTLFQ